MAPRPPDPGTAATVRAMTAALAGSHRPADLQAALTAASNGMNVDEIASLVCWLASEDCSFSTGGVFDISGGRATY